MKNKNGFYLGAVVALSIILVGIIALIVVLNRKPEKVIEDKEILISHYNYDDKIDMDLKEVAVLFDKMYEEYRLLNINSLKDEVSDFDDLTNEQKLDLAGNYFDYNRDIDGYTGKTFDDKITNDDFATYFKKVFGQEISFEDKSLLCDTYNDTNHCHVNYDENAKVYTYDEEALNHERSLPNEYYSKLLEAKRESDDTYVLTYLKVFGKTFNDVISDYYDTYDFDIEKDTKIVSNKTSVDGYEPTNLIYEALKDVNNYDKYTKYQYTIKVSGDKVYLVAYEVLKP